MNLEKLSKEIPYALRQSRMQAHVGAPAREGHDNRFHILPRKIA